MMTNLFGFWIVKGQYICLSDKSVASLPGWQLVYFPEGTVSPEHLPTRLVGKNRLRWRNTETERIQQEFLPVGEMRELGYRI